MKVRIKVLQEVELKTLLLKAGVLYWEYSEINGESDTEDGSNVPCRVGELWMPEIDIETGEITNWKEGVKAKIHYKVCDCLGYELKDEKENIILSAENGYVPKTLYPKENGYGDYIIMDINENGIIQNWKFNFSDFENSED